jgi:hypothetical protein
MLVNSFKRHWTFEDEQYSVLQRAVEVVVIWSYSRIAGSLALISAYIAMRVTGSLANLDSVLQPDELLPLNCRPWTPD